MSGCMRFNLLRQTRGFTLLEIVVTTAILILMILAALALLRGNREPRYQLQPRSDPQSTPTPKPTVHIPAPATSASALLG